MVIDWDAKVIKPTNRVFGDIATYRPAGGGTYSISGVFDAQYRETRLVDGAAVPVSDAQPVYGIRDADLPVKAAQDDEIDILYSSGKYIGETYFVREPKPDGKGHTLLLLNFKAAL